MFLSVRYPKLKKSYKSTARMNEDKLVDRMNGLVIAHKKAPIVRIHDMKPKKPKTFALK